MFILFWSLEYVKVLIFIIKHLLTPDKKIRKWNVIVIL